jgi:phosphopentomutase
VAGYAAALEMFDRSLFELVPRLKPDDMLVITADHSCDPTWNGTDHTREQVPLLVLGGDTRQEIGSRASFADVDAPIARHLGIPEPASGRAF